MACLVPTQERGREGVHQHLCLRGRGHSYSEVRIIAPLIVASGLSSPASAGLSRYEGGRWRGWRRQRCYLWFFGVVVELLCEWKTRTAEVLICQPTEGWRPSTVHSVPPDFQRVEIYVRKQRLGDAVAIAEEFNHYRLRPGNWDGRWTMVAPRPASFAGSVTP
jgi:hypothetical protein